MPRLAIRGGPTAEWGGRRNSRVYIEHRTGASLGLFRVSLVFPRSIVADVEATMTTLERLAVALVEKAPGLRMRGAAPITVTASVPGVGARAQLRIPRADLPRLRRALDRLKATGADAPSPAEILAGHLYSRCLSSFVGQLVAVTPRGDMQRRRLTLFLPAALLAIRRLISIGRGRSRSVPREFAAAVKTRGEGIVCEDRQLAEYLHTCEQRGWNLEDHAIAVGLLDRAFRGALGRELGLTNPRSIVRQHLHGKTGSLVDSLTRMSPEAHRFYLDWATRTYLGEPGEAARVFRLS